MAAQLLRRSKGLSFILMSVLKIKTAPVFVPLLAPARYKGAYGGRGSGKSHFFAERLIEDCLAAPGDIGEGLRSVCIREVQKDLAQSSKMLLESKLRSLRLGEPDGFKVYRDQIATPKDGIVIFKGMNDYNADSIKSLEGFRRAWWEEAHGATQKSLDLLRPTIRAPGSELWFSWNPRLKSDPVDKMFRGEEPPTGSVVVRANWRDNPWLTPELIQERLDCLRSQPDQYDHIWEGGYVTVVSGAYYAKAIAEARAQRRIGNVGADPLLTYHVFCDLGGTGARADAFTMWVVQFVGREIRVLDYYEVVGQPLAAHVGWLRDREYMRSRTQIWLPHDGSTHDKVFDVSFESAFRQAGYNVEVVPNQGKGAAKQRIEATRRIFHLCWFNEPTTEGGLGALGWYHEKMDERRSLGLGPEHDWSCHGADSFGLMSIVYEQQFKRENSSGGRQKIKRGNWRAV
jgi:phage terminase large subunit